MMNTSFTEIVGCRIPLQQAGMGGSAGPDLVVAVCEAGALGTLGLGGMPAGPAAVAVSEVAHRTDRPFGVNFLMPFLDPAAVESVASAARLVEFFYGQPDPGLVGTVHAGGALAAWQIGSVDEARAAADAGCDVVIAQGVEAGGHVRGIVGLLPLLDGVLDAVDLPVVAAGGIGSARAFAAVLAAGAAGARVGTRFLAAREADVHDRYLDALIDAGPEDTVLTTTFSVMWPDAPHRVLKASVDAACALRSDVVAQLEVAPGRLVDLPRLSPASPSRTTSGNIEAMPHYAGQSVGMVTGRVGAAEVVAELAEEAERLLSR